MKNLAKIFISINLLLCVNACTKDEIPQWSLLSSGITEDLNSVFFINNNTGFVTSINGTILKTVNGGRTWQRITNG
jgi:photosystem II stability/assembly factor-like uncharacterized protein